MEKALDRDTADGDRGLLRRQFVKGVGGALLAVQAGVLLTSCSCNNNTTTTNNGPPSGQGPEPIPPAETNTFIPPTINQNPPP
jgi:hypothetical protein